MPGLPRGAGLKVGSGRNLKQPEDRSRFRSRETSALVPYVSTMGIATCPLKLYADRTLTYPAGDGPGSCWVELLGGFKKKFLCH